MDELAYADDTACAKDGTYPSQPERPETGVKSLDGFVITFSPDSAGLGYDQWPVTFSISYDEATKLHAALGAAINA